MTYLLILISIAAFCNAAMDRLDNDEYTHSIWHRGILSGSTWLNRGTGKKVLGQHFDLWHVCKFIMLTSLFLFPVILFFYEIQMFLFFKDFWSDFVANFLIVGASWAIPFQLGWSFLFKAK